jgi:hypothetical protein
MPKAKNVFKSPNPTLEKAIEEALERVKADKPPLDITVKVLSVAIAWEKAKHAIMGEDDDPFDPDEDL